MSFGRVLYNAKEDFKKSVFEEKPRSSIKKIYKTLGVVFWRFFEVDCCITMKECIRVNSKRQVLLRLIL